MEALWESYKTYNFSPTVSPHYLVKTEQHKQYQRKLGHKKAHRAMH